MISAAVPLFVVLAVLAFAWPAARLAPRDLPVGVVGTGPAAQQAVAGLTHHDPGAFDFRLYADTAAARTAIVDRRVYGAIEVTADAVTVLTASAASPVVAQLLVAAAGQLGAQSGLRVSAVDLVPTAPGDPRGAVLSSALLPLTICGIALAAALVLLLGRLPAWRQVVMCVVLSALAGLGAYLIAQPFLGALPHQHVATWAALSLALLAVSGTTAGLLALLGPAGLGLSAVLMVFLGNPFSGITSAPELLPRPVDHVGQWLPPGAAASLLRSTAYFDGNAATAHAAVLAVWAVLGLAAILLGRATTIRFTAGRAGATSEAPADMPRLDLDAQQNGRTEEEAAAYPRHADLGVRPPAAAPQVG